jgi:hypothetical protein
LISLFVVPPLTAQNFVKPIRSFLIRPLESAQNRIVLWRR